MRNILHLWAYLYIQEKVWKFIPSVKSNFFFWVLGFHWMIISVNLFVFSNFLTKKMYFAHKTKRVFSSFLWIVFLNVTENGVWGGGEDQCKV